MLYKYPDMNYMLTVQASECAFNAYSGWGYIKPIPRGDVLLFSASFAVLGYCYHSSHKLPPLIASFFK